MLTEPRLLVTYQVQVDKDRFLTIAGERKRADAEKDDKYEDRKQQERKFGKFSRK